MNWTNARYYREQDNKGKAERNIPKRYSTCENCWRYPDWAPGAGYRCKCTKCGRFVGILPKRLQTSGESPDAT